jgi:energy-coupling factor transport system ATP-binding protein
MPELILEAEGFGYSYPDRSTPALEDVSLEIEPGRFTLLAGESGSGKSTLLRAAAGLVPHFHGGVASGELTVGGMSVRDNGPGELSTVCGSLFQDPESQVVMGGVRAEIALPLEQAGETPAAVARAVEEASLALGVAHLLERRTDSLSGGELQRVALAAAISTRPRLLLLDEPTAQLDPVAGDELIWLLRRLNEEWGTSVLLAEHRLERCLGAADRVIALEGGRIVCDENPGGFLDWAVAERRESFVTPVARMFAGAGIVPLPTSVKAARASLRERGLIPAAHQAAPAPATRPRARRRPPSAALDLRGVWCELKDGPAILRGVDLTLEPGERVVLMGRNGAGKSTLLRHAKGLDKPTRGKVEAAGWVALLMQNPGDYLVHDHVDEEAGPDSVAAAGLSGRGRANPRDLSGGERQRLALEAVLGGGDPAAVLLDEPTRGMDAARKHALAERLRALAAAGAAVLVATHDSAFAADFADRVVLLGAGRVLADGTPAEVLAGGWYFATEVARVLDGAGGALTPDEGASLLLRDSEVPA